MARCWVCFLAAVFLVSAQSGRDLEQSNFAHPARGVVGPAFSRPQYNLDPNWQAPVRARLEPGFPLWRFAHPNAALVIGVKTRDLSQLSLVRDMLTSAGVRGPDAGFALQSLQQMEEFWMSVVSTPGARPAVLSLATGNVPEAATDGARANGTSVRYVDSNTIILGERTAVRASIARLLARSATKAPRKDWGESSVWLIASNAKQLASLFPGRKAPLGAGHTTAAIGFGSGESKISVRITIETPTPIVAAKVAKELDRYFSSSEVAGGQVIVSSEISLDDLAARKDLATLLQPVLDASQQVSTRTKAAVIVGLDDGPKVVFQK